MQTNKKRFRPDTDVIVQGQEECKAAAERFQDSRLANHGLAVVVG